MSTNSGKSHQQVVDAKDIVEELKKGSRRSRRFLLPPKKPLLPLEPNTIIRGNLDLRNLVLDKPLEIRDCHFKGKVDLRNSEFRQLVNFSGCTFRKEFNSGDATHALTIYRKDLICHRSRFENAAYFNGIQVEGDAYFEESCFELERLETPPDSQLGSKYTVDFTDAHFEHQLVCDRATFKGPVTFKAINCDGSGYFNRCRFITGTRIEDEPEIDFNWASFGRNLWCQNAEYRAEVNFRSVKCGYNAFFKSTLFGEKVDLRYLDVGRNLDLRWTYGAERVKLGQIHVPKKLRLGGACFKSAVELYDSNIGVLELWDPNYPADKAIEVRTTEEDHLEPAIHKGHAELELLDRADQPIGMLKRLVYRLFPSLKGAKRQAKADSLAEKLFPFKSTDLNLTETTFERFHGGPNEALAKTLAFKLADSQHPTKFSIAPYLQLRSHYLKIGDESTAGAARAHGYVALRKNAWSNLWGGPGRTRWSLKRWMAEVLLYWPTSYGHRVWPILLPAIVALLIIGTYVFWPPERLEVMQGTDYEPPHESPRALKVLERSVYSLDLLVPALNLRYEAMWVPESGWLLGWLYATLHSILGWILIALFITWLTGVIKPSD